METTSAMIDQREAPEEAARVRRVSRVLRMLNERPSLTAHNTGSTFLNPYLARQARDLMTTIEQWFTRAHNTDQGMSAKKKGEATHFMPAEKIVKKARDGGYHLIEAGDYYYLFGSKAALQLHC